MLARHVDVRAADGALDERPEPFNRVRVIVAAHVLIATMQNRSVLEARQPAIGTLSGVSITVAVLVGLTVTAYLVAQVSGGNMWADGSVRYLLGLLYGVNLVHFWVDAFIWKFSDKDVREQHGEAFAF
jgi:hypothetical protein